MRSLSGEKPLKHPRVPFRASLPSEPDLAAPNGPLLPWGEGVAERVLLLLPSEEEAGERCGVEEGTGECESCALTVELI